MNIEMYRIFFNIQKQHWWFVIKKEIILDAISLYTKLKPNSQILDIGCGSGLMLNALEKIGITNGMDMSSEAIAFSREIFSGPVKQGSLPKNVPYPENSFELITALDVIEHIDDDTASLVTIKNLLSPSGKAIITVPAYMFLWSKFDEMNEHKRRYTLRELEQKLKNAGLQVENISYFNSLLFPIIFLIRKLNNIIGRDGISDVDMPGYLVNQTLKRIFGLEKFLLRILKLPFGVSILAIVKK
jgi:SAM-dependent methyltransferase